MKENELLEYLKKEQRKNQEKQQNDFANKILTDIEWWCEKSNKADYEPTIEERECLKQVITIVNNMNTWF